MGLGSGKAISVPGWRWRAREARGATVQGLVDLEDLRFCMKWMQPHLEGFEQRNDITGMTSEKDCSCYCGSESYWLDCGESGNQVENCSCHKER